MDQPSDEFLINMEVMRETYARRRRAAIADGDPKMVKACQDSIAHIEKMIRRELASNA
ncbi:MAG: hypothetical protein AAB281_01495 [Actinomycetota bacterium]